MVDDLLTDNLLTTLPINYKNISSYITIIFVYFIKYIDCMGMLIEDFFVISQNPSIAKFGEITLTRDEGTLNMYTFILWN